MSLFGYLFAEVTFTITFQLRLVFVDTKVFDNEIFIQKVAGIGIKGRKYTREVTKGYKNGKSPFHTLIHNKGKVHWQTVYDINHHLTKKGPRKPEPFYLLGNHTYFGKATLSITCITPLLW